MEKKITLKQIAMVGVMAAADLCGFRVSANTNPYGHR